jgi:predicted Zn-dependent protease
MIPQDVVHSSLILRGYSSSRMQSSPQSLSQRAAFRSGRSDTVRLIPPLAARLAAGRPVLAQEEMHSLVERIMNMTTSPSVVVEITHTAQVVTRLANGQVLSGDDGDTLTIRIGVGTDGEIGQGYPTTRLETNQLNVQVLKAIVAQAEAIERDRLKRKENPNPVKLMAQDTYIPVHLWHQSVIDAMHTARTTALPALLLPFRSTGLTAAGFVGLMARSEAYYDRQGITAYNEETDSEVTITARGSHGESGWSGQTARDWTMIDSAAVAAKALKIAKMSANPVAVEPGRRTAILSAEAMGQIARTMAYRQFSQHGFNGFHTPPKKYRWGGRYFDPRITISSDPADPDGGFRPFFQGPLGTRAITWVENGLLRNLVAGLKDGKPYVDFPHSMRISGGPTSEEEMIAQCKEGVYVNRLYNVQEIDERSGLQTGVTRDGCFLVKDGKIVKAVKNFRFHDSPFFMWNKLEVIGPTRRVALGFIPRTYGTGWPLSPIIVPPMMVHDFNFSSLADAV